MAIRFHTNICSGGVKKDIVLMGFSCFDLNKGGNIATIRTRMETAFSDAKKIAVDETDSLETTLMEEKSPVGVFYNTGYKYMYVCKTPKLYTSIVYRGYKLDGTYTEQIISATNLYVNPVRIDVSDADIIMASPYASWSGDAVRFMSVKFSNNIYSTE